MTAATPVEQTERDFADFVTTRGAALWRSAWLLTGDTHKAEDLVQAALALGVGIAQLPGAAPVPGLADPRRRRPPPS